MDLWVEQYRPSSLDGYVFKNEDVQAQVEQWLKDGYTPGHMLFSGPQGTGKTTLAKLLLKEFGIPGGDILEINGSNEGRKIEVLRDKLEGFSLSYSLGGGLRYVLLDEADYLNPHSVQPALRNLMEKCADSCRYILTCNYPHKIIPPLHSRVQQIQFEKLDNTEFTTRSIEVLMNENIDFDPELISKYVDMTYPDLRKCINLLQQNSVTGKLTDPDSSTGGDLDFLVESMDLFAKGKIIEARKIICSQAREDDYPAIYKFLYENVDVWFDDATLQDDVYIFLAKYLHQNGTSDDREINLAGCLSAIGKLIGQ